MAYNSPYIAGLKTSLTEKQKRSDPFYQAYLEQQAEAERYGGLPPLSPLNKLSGLAALQSAIDLQAAQQVSPMKQYAEGGLIVGGVNISDEELDKMARTAYAESTQATPTERKRIVSTMINRAAIDNKPISDVLTKSQYNAVGNSLYNKAPKAALDAIKSQIKDMIATNDITTDTHYVTPERAAQMAKEQGNWVSATLSANPNGLSKEGSHLFTSMMPSVDPNYGGIKNISAREKVLYGPTGIPTPSYRPDPRFSDPIYGWDDPMGEFADLPGTVPVDNTEQAPEQAGLTDWISERLNNFTPTGINNYIDKLTNEFGNFAKDIPGYETYQLVTGQRDMMTPQQADESYKKKAWEIANDPSLVMNNIATSAKRGGWPAGIDNAILNGYLKEAQANLQARKEFDQADLDMALSKPVSSEPYNEWSASKYPSIMANELDLEDEDIGKSLSKVVDSQSINSPANQAEIQSIYEKQMASIDPAKRQDRITDTPTYMGLPGYAATIATQSIAPNKVSAYSIRPSSPASINTITNEAFNGVPGRRDDLYSLAQSLGDISPLTTNINEAALTSYLNEPYDPSQANRLTKGANNMGTVWERQALQKYEMEKKASELNAADEAAYQAAVARTLTPSRVERDPYLAARLSSGLDIDSIGLDIGTDSLGGVPRALDPVDVMGVRNAPQSYLEAPPRSNPYNAISPNVPKPDENFLTATNQAFNAAQNLAAAARMNAPQAALITSTITAPQVQSTISPDLQRGVVSQSPYPAAPRPNMPPSQVPTRPDFNVPNLVTEAIKSNPVADIYGMPGTGPFTSVKPSLSPVTQKGFGYVSPMGNAISQMKAKTPTGEISSISTPTSTVDARALNSYNSVLNKSQQNINTEYGKAIAAANAIQPNGVSNVKMQNLKGNMPRMDLVRPTIAADTVVGYRGPATTLGISSQSASLPTISSTGVTGDITPQNRISPSEIRQNNEISSSPSIADKMPSIPRESPMKPGEYRGPPSMGRADNYTPGPKKDQSRMQEYAIPAGRQEMDQAEIDFGNSWSGPLTPTVKAEGPSPSTGGGRGGGGSAGKSASAALTEAIARSQAPSRAQSYTSPKSPSGTKSISASGNVVSKGYAVGYEPEDDVNDLLGGWDTPITDGVLPGATTSVPQKTYTPAPVQPAVVGRSSASVPRTSSSVAARGANGPAGLAGTGGSMSSRNASYSNNQNAPSGRTSNSQTSYDSKGNVTGRSYTDSKGRTHSTTVIGGREYTNASGSSGAGSGGGSTILCTYFMKKGWLPVNIWKADMTHAKTVNPIMREGYYAWAEPCIKRMKVGDKKSRILEYALWQVVKGWSYEAAYMSGYLPSGTIYGKIIRAIFEPMSYAIGKFKRMKNSNKKVEV